MSLHGGEFGRDPLHLCCVALHCKNELKVRTTTCFRHESYAPEVKESMVLKSLFLGQHVNTTFVTWGSLILTQNVNGKQQVTNILVVPASILNSYIDLWFLKELLKLWLLYDEKLMIIYM